MPLVLNRDEVLSVYEAASRRKWVLPAFNAENQTACEAILSAVYECGQSIGVNDLPVIIAITNNYSHRPQSHYYTHTRNWKLGLRLFMDDIRLLTSSDSPFANLRVMIHLDHVQWDSDGELLNWDLHQFSSIMYDASSLPFDMNIRKTAEFVEKNRDKIVIEGACDEIKEASATADKSITTTEMAEKYYKQTSVDLVVANLGTEHRAGEASRKYYGDQAREISRRIGPRLCLHGTSSVSHDQLSRLFDDGIRKVNIWTVLERDSTAVLFQSMVKNATKLIGREKVQDLIRERLLGEEADILSSLSVAYFTTAYRQNIVFNAMRGLVNHYLELWYK